MRPVFTIIVPSYNNAGYLSSCVGSFSSKESSVEIIVVDDGSTDDTQHVLAELSKENPDIRVITQANGGVSSARNAGLREATGRFVMFVDADDRLFSEALNQISRNIGNYDEDIVVFTMISEGHEMEQWKGRFEENRHYAATDLIQRGYIRGSACGCMFRLDYLKESGVTFSNDLTMAEDTVFFACAIAAGASVSFSDIRLYEVIPRNGSASRIYDETFLHRYGKSLQAARRLIPDRCVADNTILTILMGIVNVAAKTGHSAKETEKICAVDSVLPLSVPVMIRHKWLVRVLNHDFSLFFAIKKLRDRFLP